MTIGSNDMSDIALLQQLREIAHQHLRAAVSQEGAQTMLREIAENSADNALKAILQDGLDSQSGVDIERMRFKPADLLSHAHGLFNTMPDSD